MREPTSTTTAPAARREATHSAWRPDQGATDEAFQDQMLQGVSRTFALTIPQLPPRLAPVVSNGYLLCRIIDTIEDEVSLSPMQKHRFCEEFTRVVSGEAPPESLARELAPLLSERTLPAERALIRHIPRVIGITRGFTPAQRGALETCVAVMARGMTEFQDGGPPHGLSHREHLDRYCYHVAGCVGEMLTRLFCDYSPEIARRGEALMRLAVSFGQGLQMTNILKDVWDDRSRGVCWLPRDVFAAAGFDLARLAPGNAEPGFRVGLAQLIAVAHGHLRNALAYTLLIPSTETGIRNFCLWALGMAVLTLRKIHRHPDFSSGQQVKISRRSVRATMLTSRLAAHHDGLLRSLFSLVSLGLPSQTARPRQPRSVTS